MKINVDISNANMWGSGICIFENEIISRIYEANDDLELIGCTNFRRGIPKQSLERFPFKVVYSYIPYKLVYNYYVPFSYESMMGESKLNLFCTYSLPKVRYKTPTIATIHDLILQKVGNENKKVIEQYDKQVRHAIKVADHIITVSNATKQDLIECYNVNENMVTVVYNGVDFDRFAMEISDDRKKIVSLKYGLPSKFFLYFGAVRKHKNIENMIKAYSILPKHIRDEYKLVITKETSELQEFVNRLKLGDYVIFTKYIDEEDKECLYQMAFATVFVSYYEGFGLPIIESMAAGTPVITSNTSSMPEVAGGAALLVNPYEVESIEAAMKKLVENPDVYSHLVTLGEKNAKKFTWNSSADRVAGLIRKMI